MGSNSTNDLFAGAVDEGLISADTALVLAAPDLGAQIQAGLGADVDTIEAQEVNLVTLLIDNSGSIRMSGNAQAVRDGHNQVVTSLRATKQGKAGSIFIGTRYLNDTVINKYVTVVNAVLLDAKNYNPNYHTPLYDKIVETLGTVLRKSKDFRDCGVVCRTQTLIMTDGHDEGSERNDIADCGKLVRDLLMAETHIVMAMGIADAVGTDFRGIFGDMQIPNECILTPANTDSEIRRCFGMFSQSAVQASQSPQNFSKALLGGFNQP